MRKSAAERRTMKLARKAYLRIKCDPRIKAQKIADAAAFVMDTRFGGV